MSMIGYFVSATDEEIRHLLTTPDDIVAFLGPLRGPQQMGERSLRIDKSCHALHWLLTGTAEEGEPPLNFIVAGGTEIGDVDAGYGPARAFTHAEVRSIDEALAPISTVDLLARFDGAAMRDLYPLDVWDRADERGDNLEYLAHYFDLLKAFVARATQQRLGIIAFAS